jgi:hypothetical protein
VRLVEPGGDLRFAQESLAEARILREFGDQYLERDLPPLGILCEVDGARRTAPSRRAIRYPATTLPVSRTSGM